MKIRSIAFAAVLAVLALSGCATRTPMAFEKDTDHLTEKSKPVFLMTATIKNNYKPSYQPKLLVVNVEKTGAQNSADKLNFLIDDKARNEGDSEGAGNNYLLRLELDPGQYEIVGLTSMYRSLFVNSFFVAHMDSPIDVQQNGVYYLGHINAVVRERKEDEVRAGPSIPLIDQAVSGASGGTFVVDISDQLSSDEAMFRSRFPALAGVEIKKAILPDYDVAAVKKWWDAH